MFSADSYGLELKSLYYIIHIHYRIEDVFPYFFTKDLFIA
jgi:hypothetical protein